MSVSRSSFMLLLLVAIANCDVNYYPYYGTGGVSGSGQVLIRRPHVHHPASISRISVLDADHAAFGGFPSRPLVPAQHVVGSPIVFGSDIDSSDIYKDDSVVVIG
ncbi:hypothetical protein CHS0354_023171 [Potamilus streckersoni]|uniref:Uncharacterized protein n=1 Tax=Potamilus streckersoni TaxID=2493646 RepID=A0AAE0TBV8_9BIVA|nr:hypothetical protein CHS0354_023171 [Potamilus streckersoni]